MAARKPAKRSIKFSVFTSATGTQGHEIIYSSSPAAVIKEISKYAKAPITGPHSKFTITPNRSGTPLIYQGSAADAIKVMNKIKQEIIDMKTTAKKPAAKKTVRKNPVEKKDLHVIAVHKTGIGELYLSKFVEYNKDVKQPGFDVDIHKAIAFDSPKAAQTAVRLLNTIFSKMSLYSFPVKMAAGKAAFPGKK